MNSFLAISSTNVSECPQRSLLTSYPQGATLRDLWKVPSLRPLWITLLIAETPIPMLRALPECYKNRFCYCYQKWRLVYRWLSWDTYGGVHIRKLFCLKINFESSDNLWDRVARSFAHSSEDGHQNSLSLSSGKGAVAGAVFLHNHSTSNLSEDAWET